VPDVHRSADAEAGGRLKQILQSARTGELELAEVPAPLAGAGQVLVRTAYSVVSPGTETLAMEFARSSLLGKARSRPDLVRQVAKKLRQEGPHATWRAVTTRLDAPQALGYSCAGIIEAVGEGVTGFARGDRVACAGAGYASHAEWNAVPENLVALVPEGVSLRDAAYATVGAIALQGLRLARPTLGEIAAVVGLGLIGQLAVQCLRANGCRVVGLDPNPERAKQARDLGAEWVAAPGELGTTWRDHATGGYGVDLALVTASAESPAPLVTAAEICRRRGRISLVGAVPIDLDRRLLYEKELELTVSMSYGPGRYDRRYEELGLDYPLPFVRWTENRNLQAFLGLVASGAVCPERLDAEVVPFADAERVYAELARGDRSTLSLVFEYPRDASPERSVRVAPPAPAPAEGALGVAVIGAGNYARSVLLPALSRCEGLQRVGLVAATGGSARRSAERFGFEVCSTDPGTAFADPRVRLVFVATRHDSHATLAEAALRAGKAVWLEKPVGLSPEEVDRVVAAARESSCPLFIGYNRRFSPHARAMREALAGRRGPLALHYSVAAGPTPSGTWITDPRAGGGRIVGEVCHFVDLCTFLTAAAPVSLFARALGRDPEHDDSTVAVLSFVDGSTATIEYLARTDPALPKERIEASADGLTVRCENFRSTRVSGRRTFRTWNQDKGQVAAVTAALEAVRRGTPSPFDLEEIATVSRATFAILESCRSGRAVDLVP